MARRQLMQALVTFKADFRAGTGPAKAPLIVPWMVGAAVLIGLSLYMGSAGIEARSGTVGTITSDLRFGMHATLVSSSEDFFFDDIDFPQLPDIRVGDQVDILTVPQPTGWAIAVQSQRGTWVSIYHDAAAPFTPVTWPVHEGIRWLALTLGFLAALFAAASLIRWLASRPRSVTPIVGTAQSTVAPDMTVASEVVPPVQPTEPRPAGSAGLSVPERSVAARFERPRPASDGVGRTGHAPVSDRALVAVWIGGVTVAAFPILEFIAFAGQRCPVPSYMYVLLAAIPIAVASGAISTLLLASRSTGASPERAHAARKFGIIAIVIAVASAPVNAIVMLVASVCTGFF